MKTIFKKAPLSVVIILSLSSPVHAGPNGGQVTSGSGSIGQSGNVTSIQQLTDLLNIDWESFDIGSQEQVIFYQPGKDSIAINNIIGNDASEIFGKLQANGNVFLINPNGVLFSEGAQIDVGGLLVSDHKLNVDDDGAYWLTPGTGEGVINAGQILADGNVVILAGSVLNAGSIESHSGDIDLVANSDYLMSLNPEGTLWVALEKEIVEGDPAEILMSGSLTSQNGSVNLQALSGHDLLDSRIELTGDINIADYDDPDGVAIEISADDFLMEGGSIDVDADALISIEAESELTLQDASIDVGSTQNGGQVHMTADKVLLLGETDIDASGTHQGGEVWVGGSYQGGGGIESADYLGVGRNVEVNVSATAQGDAGEAILWADKHTIFNGEVRAEGGQVEGDGGFVEISGKEILQFDGNVSTLAENGERGTLLLDPDHIVIANGAGGADDAQVGDGVINLGDGGTATYTISEQALEGLSAATNINLQANQSITIQDLADNNLTLDTTGTVRFEVSNTNTGTNNGSASFTMDASDTIELTGTADLTIQVAGAANGSGTVSVDVGNITAQGAVTISAQNLANPVAGDVSVTLNSITTQGDVNLKALANDGAITTGGSATVTVGSGGINVTSATGDPAIDIEVRTVSNGNALIDINGSLTSSADSGSNRINLATGDATGTSVIQLQDDITTQGGSIYIEGEDIVMTGDTTLDSVSGQLFLNATNALDGGGFNLTLGYGSTGGNFLSNSSNLGSVLIAFNTANHVFLGSGTENYLTPLGGSIDTYTQAAYDALSSSDDVKFITSGSIEVDGLVLSEGLSLEAAGNIWVSDVSGGFFLDLEAPNVYLENSVSTTDALSFTSVGNLELNDATVSAASIDFGTLSAFSVTGAGASSVSSVANLDMSGISVTETNNGDLTLGSDGALTSGSINLGTGAVSLEADQNNNGTETLTLAGNIVAGDVNLSGGVTNNETISQNANVDINSSGTLTLTGIDSWEFANNASVSANTLNVGAATNWNLQNTSANTVTIDTVDDIDITGLTINQTNNGSLALFSDGNITTGAINLGTGTMSLNASQDNAGAETITIGGNVTAGALTVSGGTDANDNVNFSGTNLTLTGGAGDGALTLSNLNDLSLVNGAAIDVTNISQAGVATWTLAGSATVTTSEDLDLGATGITSSNGNLDLNSGLSITAGAIDLGTGALTVSGDTDNNTNGASITLQGDISASAVTINGGTDNNDALTISGTTPTIALTGDMDLNNLSGVTMGAGADIDANALNQSNVGAWNWLGSANLTTAQDLVLTNNMTMAGDVVLTSDGSITVADLNAGSANVTLNADNDNTESATVTLNGDITATDLTLGGTGGNDTLVQTDNSDLNTTGTISLGGINSWSFGDNTSVNANTLNAGAATNWTLNNDSANTLTIDIADDIDITGLTITQTNNGSLALFSDGNITTGAINLGTGTISLNASQDSTGAETITIGGDVTAGAMNVSGGTDANDNVNFSGTNLALSGGAGNGALTLSNLNDLSLVDGATINVTNISQAGVATWTLAGAATVTTSEDLNLGATEITSSNGDLNLNSGANVTTGAIDLGTGTLSIAGDNDNNSANASVTLGGAIVADSMSITGGSDGDDSLTLSGVNLPGSLTLNNLQQVDLADASVINVDNLMTTSVGQWNWAGSGSLVVAQDLTLSSQHSAAGNLSISSEGNLNVGDINASGNLTLTANEDNAGTETLTLNGDITGQDVTLLGAGTDELIQSAGSDIDAGGDLQVSDFDQWQMNGAISVQANSIQTTAVDTWTYTGNQLQIATQADLDLTTLDIQASNYDLTVSSGQNLTLDALNAGTGNLVLRVDNDSSGTDILTVNGSLEAASITLNGGTDNNDQVRLNGSVTTLGTLSFDGIEQLSVQADQELTSSQWQSGDLARLAFDGSGAINVTQGSLDLGNVTTTGANAIVLNAGADMTLGSVNTPEQLTVTANTTDTSADIRFNGAVNALGVDIDGANSVTNLYVGDEFRLGAGGIQAVNLGGIAIDANIESSGSIELTSAGNMTQSDGSRLISNLGNIVLTASDNIAVSSLQVDSDSGVEIRVNAGGDITDVGDTHVDVIADNESLVTLSAGRRLEDLEYSYEDPEPGVDLDDTLQDAVEDSLGPLRPDDAVGDEQEQEQMLADSEEAEENSIGSAFGSQCPPNDDSPECQVVQALESFAGSLLVGGELPD